MKGGLEVIIKPDGFGFLMIGGRGSFSEEVRENDADAGVALSSFCKKHGLRTGTVNLFLAEELVYTTSLNLPLGTPSLSEAIRFQLGMLVPFSDQDILHGYAAVRVGDSYRVTISAARSGHVIALVEQLIRAGYVVKGIYPESQRYVTGKWRKLKWALVMPSATNLNKIFVFDGSRLSDRFLNGGDGLKHDELVNICRTENIFHPDPPADSKLKPLQMLMAAPPLLKDYNMLPASYRHRDYIKIATIALAVLNIVGLIAIGGLQFIEQGRLIDKADQEIIRLQPLVHETREVREQIKYTEDFFGMVGELKGNPQLFPFLENLTMTLPEGSYLNQLRINVTEGTAVINGFTDDVGGLTEKLQSVGETRLQSTSRRKNMIYFQVEISLP